MMPMVYNWITSSLSHFILESDEQSRDSKTIFVHISGPYVGSSSDGSSGSTKKRFEISPPRFIPRFKGPYYKKESSSSSPQLHNTQAAKDHISSEPAAATTMMTKPAPEVEPKGTDPASEASVSSDSDATSAPSRRKPRGKQLYLTFDDGPWDPTLKVMELLKVIINDARHTKGDHHRC